MRMMLEERKAGKEVKKEARKRNNSPISVPHFMPIYCDNLLRLPLVRPKSLVELVFYFYADDLIGSNSGQIFSTNTTHTIALLQIVEGL